MQSTNLGLILPVIYIQKFKKFLVCKMFHMSRISQNTVNVGKSSILQR